MERQICFSSVNAGLGTWWHPWFDHGMLVTAHKWPNYNLCTSAVISAHTGMHSGTREMWCTVILCPVQDKESWHVWDLHLFRFFVATFWLTAIQKSVSLSYVCILQVGVYTASIKTFWCLSLLFYWIMYLSFLLKPSSCVCGSCFVGFFFSLSPNISFSKIMGCIFRRTSP